MAIEEHIGVIEDLKSTMSVCMPEPEKTEICTSLSEAIDTMRKYQKIKEQVDIAIDKENFAISGARLIQIREIINGNVD